jgi:hypothetical protein
MVNPIKGMIAKHTFPHNLKLFFRREPLFEVWQPIVDVRLEAMLAIDLLLDIIVNTLPMLLWTQV